MALYYKGKAISLTKAIEINKASPEYVRFQNYKGTSLDLSWLDTKNMTNMYAMFSGCERLQSIDVSGFDTSKVTNMGYMFNGCSGLASLDVSNFNTSKVTNMEDMFYALSHVVNLNLANFDIGEVTNLNNLVREGSLLETIDLTGWDTSGCSSMGSMFAKCSKLINIIGVLDIISITSPWVYLFSSCTNLQSVTLKNIKLSGTIGTSSYGTKLTLDTLINTIKELWDYSTSTSTHTLTMGTANLNKITNTYVKLITPTEEQIAQDPNINNKMPCEVCESTDEGAMLISDYATLKKWTLA